MDLIAVLISLGALAVAALGYFVNRRSLGLLEQQVGTSGRAVVKAGVGSVSWGDPHIAYYRVTFTNSGPAAAKDVQYRVIDEEGHTHAEGEIAVVLMPGVPTDRKLSVPRAEYESLVLLVGWLDKEHHEEAVLSLATKP